MTLCSIVSALQRGLGLMIAQMIISRSYPSINPRR